MTAWSVGIDTLDTNMAMNKPSKIDLLLFLSLLLAIHIALRIISILAIDNQQESNAHNRSQEDGQIVPARAYGKRKEDLGIAGNGQGSDDSPDGDDFRPRFPFFSLEYLAIPVITTVDVVEDELRAIARQAAESPSIAGKQDQEENNMVLSLAATESIEADKVHQ